VISRSTEFDQFTNAFFRPAPLFPKAHSNTPPEPMIRCDGIIGVNLILYLTHSHVCPRQRRTSTHTALPAVSRLVSRFWAFLPVSPKPLSLLALQGESHVLYLGAFFSRAADNRDASSSTPLPLHTDPWNDADSLLPISSGFPSCALPCTSLSLQLFRTFLTRGSGL
jgi:hypothetical protein